MIILTMRSGAKVPIRGEKWADIRSTQLMGAVTVRDDKGHELTVRADAVDLAANIPQAEWDLQRAGAWVRRHKIRFFFLKLRRKLGLRPNSDPMAKAWEDMLLLAERATRRGDAEA